MPTTSSPIKAPAYALHRETLVADTGTEENKNHGMNMAGFEYAHIQVIPAAGVNPTAKVLFWSEIKGAFVRQHTEISKAGVGAAIPYEFTVECRGRIIYVFLSVNTGLTKVAVAGFNVIHPS